MKDIIEKLGISKTPWEIDNDLMVYCDSPTGQRVADCTVNYSHEPYLSLKANTQLIATAPEMLEFLIKHAIGVDEDCELIRLIGKATGKTWIEIKGLLDE